MPKTVAAANLRSQVKQCEGAGPDDGGGTRARVSAAEFRAATEQRLRSLKREVAEVKGRINGLIFVVAGAVITQVVLRLVQ